MSAWQVVDPPRRPVLFVNPKSGRGKAARAGLAARARELGIDAIVLRPHDDLAELAAEAVAGGADALGAAGGDGSLAVVAAAALANGLPFVCVPAGTRNHFALDLGVDRGDLAGALEAFTDGVERRIDGADVNGRLFLNNVSLGLYGDAVRQPGYRSAKARTLLETAASVLGPSATTTGLELVDDRGVAHRDPVVALVSNNPYALDPPAVPGTRAALDTGEIGVIVLDKPRAGRSSERMWTAPNLVVAGSAPLHAGIDGEAADLTPPLRFGIEPGALRVRISRRHESARRPPQLP